SRRRASQSLEARSILITVSAQPPNADHSRNDGFAGWESAPDLSGAPETRDGNPSCRKLHARKSFVRWERLMAIAALDGVCSNLLSKVERIDGHADSSRFRPPFRPSKR